MIWIQPLWILRQKEYMKTATTLGYELSNLASSAYSKQEEM